MRGTPGVLPGVVLALAATACGSARSDERDVASGPLPVITPDTQWDGGPTAEVEGPLALRDGCLLLDGRIVFWPHGTRWDAARRAVVLQSAGPVAVGEDFDGGGGYYDLRGDVSGPLDVESWLGEDAGAAIRACSRSTGTTELVLARDGQPTG
jgi:hypothetical protein